MKKPLLPGIRISRLLPATAAWSALLLILALLTSTRVLAQAPANDNPCGAVQLSLNGSLCTTPTVGTNVGATTTTINGTVANTCGAFNNQSPKDVWYKFTTDATGNGSVGATITVTGNPAGLIRLFSAPSCTGTFTQIVCSASNAANTAAPRLVTGALQPNTTYYVQVAGFTSTDTQGQFTICITDPPACGAPAVLGVTFPTGTSASVSFTAGPGNTTFTATLQGGGPGQTVPNATSPVLFSGLIPGNTYFVSISTTCGGNTLNSPFFSFTVPLLNDEPCGAISLPITGTCTPTTGTTFGASTTPPNGYTNPACAADVSPMDVWYQFTTPATGGASTSATISVTGSPAGQIRLFSGASCGGPLNQLACSQSPSGPALPLSSTTLTPNTTYYVMVAGYSDNSPRGQFTICVTGAAACPDPTNFNVVSTSTTTANVTFTPGANATSYNITYAPQSGGTPVTLTATGSPVQLTGLVSGTTYNVTLQSVCPAGVGSVLTKTFTATSGAPSNDECVSATPINSVGIGSCGGLVQASTTGATASIGAPNPGCATFVNSDVWFSVVVPSNGILQVETGPVAGSRMNDTGMAFYTGTCGNLTLIGCDDDSGTGSFSLLRRTGLVPGSTLYVRVWPFGNFPTGDFTLCAQSDVLCPNVTNLAINNVTSTSASLAFTAPPAASSYTVTYTPQGGTVTVLTPNATSSPVPLTGLTPNTVYTVTIQSNCTAGQGLPLALTFTTAPPAPANDNCTGATALTIGTTCTPVTTTTFGATPSAAPVPAPTCGTGVVNDVWFTVTVPANGVVQLATGAVSGSPVSDTGLQLYSGTCGALTSLGCNDNFGSSLFSQVRATGLTPGSTVYARAWQIGSAAGGAFSICAVTDPPCPAPSNLTVTGITTTSATVGFTTPSAGTSYTVTYMPQGGTATTITPAPTGSPVVLSGLLPGTTYMVSIVSNCAPGETSLAATTTFTTLTPPACPVVTGLTASNITTTSVLVSFIPGAGNTSFEVTYLRAGASQPVPVLPAPTGSPVTITGLLPNTQYTVCVVGQCGSQMAPVTCVNFTTAALPTCSAPTNLAISAVTSTTAVVNFTPSSSATSYTVTYTAPGGNPITVTPAPTASPVSLSGLTPNTPYTVTVVSNCGPGQTSAPVTTTFTTTALPACPPVTNVAVGSITSTTASVSFTPGAGNTSYRVSYVPVGGTLPVFVTSATSPVAITGLQPNTQYSVCVSSDCGAGFTGTPVCTTFGTLPGTATCAAPTNLAVSAVTGTTAQVTFTPSASATGYTVTYTRQPGGTPIVVPATGSPVNLAGLQTGSNYTVSVVSNCAGGQTSAAVTTTFSTLIVVPTCPPVTNLAVSNITPSGVTASFTPPAGGTLYTLTFTPPGSTPPIVLTTASSSLAVTGLASNTLYSLCVTSSCSGQAGIPVCINFSTAAGPVPCTPPTNLVVTNVTNTTATLTFTPSPSAVSYTIGYQVAQGPIQTVPANGSPFTLTGLTPNTAYTLSIASNCSGGLASMPGQPVAFTTRLTGTANGALAELVNLYPNPAQRAFQLEVPAALTRKAVRVTLLNTLGQQVQQRSLPASMGGQKVEFDVTNLPRGVYSVLLSTAEGTVVKRLVVE
ncbi:fibronectin type III domain-containing protein [Hymenobacter sp. BT175]|uniref:fibronectin type III domain-containing protein n=1 Tax=Hymenobacter translucens TaxID=2886507 RepID=UPI001D0E02DE|nr:fibronectin type III domain-containing protein [Hymenobacter translucens]MCC2547239.1 fibronectin type III domain-containing protein [Hymenobacter translucens]